jgi:hypothetical protein
MKNTAKKSLLATYLLVSMLIISKPAFCQNVIWGSSAGPFTNEKGVSSVQAWERLNVKIKESNGGHGLHARRSYEGFLPETFSASNMSADVNLCKASLYSFKTSWSKTASGDNYQEIKQFVQTIPDDRTVYLIFFHEPEDDIPSQGSSDVFTTAFARFVDAVLDAGKPNVHPTFVLMSWTWNPNSGRNPEDWNVAPKLKPDQLNRVIAGLDGYSHDPVGTSAESAIGRGIGFSEMATWGFSRFGIFETSTRRLEGPSGRAKWISDLGEWIRRDGKIEVVSWFHSGVGPNAGAEGWFLGQWWIDEQGNYFWEDTDGSVAAYAKLVKDEDVLSRWTDQKKLTNPIVYPNPFNDNLTINTPGVYSYSIYSMEGKLLEHGNNMQNKVAGTHLNDGIYLIKIKTQEQVQIIKMIKQLN